MEASMAKSVRAFIAVKVEAPRSLRAVISALGEMGGPVKAVDSDILHVTLKFLGDTDPRQLGDVGQAVQAAAAGRSAFQLRIAGLGAFPTPARPSVVWAGLEEAEPLVEIATDLETSLEALGFACESRPFHPHLTLARVRSRPPGELGALLRDQATRNFGSAKIDTVELMQSDLGPGGPRYTALARAKLA
jgi:2'-5' RNA ligase